MKSTDMDWWKGMDVLVGSETMHVENLLEVLDEVGRIPVSLICAPMRMPTSGMVLTAEWAGPLRTRSHGRSCVKMWKGCFWRLTLANHMCGRRHWVISMRASMKTLDINCARISMQRYSRPRRLAKAPSAVKRISALGGYKDHSDDNRLVQGTRLDGR